MPVIVYIAFSLSLKTVEITEKLQILRKSNKTQVHGGPAVIVYTSMCTSIVLLTWKNLPNEHRNHKRIKI